MKTINLSSVKIDTGIVIRYENGHTAPIYKSMTKKGLRYYRYERMQMRYFPISELEVFQRAIRK